MALPFLAVPLLATAFRTAVSYAAPVIAQSIPAIARIVGSGAVATGRTAAAIASRPLTWGSIAAASSAGYALKAAEYYTGGALSQTLLETGVAHLKSAVESGSVTLENVESHIDTAVTVMNIANVMDSTTIQNGVVASTMMAFGENSGSPEAITAGKNAALTSLLMPHNALAIMAKHGIRAQVVDNMFDNRDEADRYLAEKFVDNIVSGAQVNALGDNQITRDDVRAHLAAELAKPDSRLGHILREGRMQNGLQQIWPDLDFNTALAAVTPNETPAETPTDLSDNFRTATEDLRSSTTNLLGDLRRGAEQTLNNQFMQMLTSLPVVGPIIAFFAKIGEWIGELKNMFGNDTVAQTDNPERLAALRERMEGGQLPTILSHDGASTKPTITPEQTLVPIP